MGKPDTRACGEGASGVPGIALRLRSRSCTFWFTAVVLGRQREALNHEHGLTSPRNSLDLWKGAAVKAGQGTHGRFDLIDNMIRNVLACELGLGPSTRDLCSQYS